MLKKGKAANKKSKKYQWQILIEVGVPAINTNFVDAKYWLNYFPPIAKRFTRFWFNG